MTLFDPQYFPENPTSAEEYNRRGWAYTIQGEHSQAEEDFRRALDLQNDAVDALYGLGLVTKKRGRTEWQPAFERVIQLLEAGAMRDNRPRAVILRHLAQTQLSYLPEKDWKQAEE
jgi:tetratricopeptide (TPR) repeat protein